ncbi:protein Wnt 1 [Echinococcus multilocularis]|uniref:Protein Wnt n=1 Tax=Echinococcus multilocularis TaxID=6211 RepID=A0A068Y201_ECHMU|nr:protein Wnt 1 [Echinococcus multilocularis]
MSAGVRVILPLAVLLILFFARTHSQLTWKGGLKYLVSPPFKSHHQMQQENSYDNDVSISNGPRDDLNLDKLVQKPTGRWWLDSLARLLYNHPLHLSKYVREISIPSRESLNYETPPSLLNFPRLRSRSSNSPIMETRDWQMYDQVWAVHKLRQLLASYRQWFSPRQWKQFLHKTPPQRPSSQPQEESVHLELLEAAVQGVRAAVAECQHQFRNDRWNCSEIISDKNALFGNILSKGVPETAFVYALVSASVVRSVSEACLTNLRNCPCNNRGRESFEGGYDMVNWQWQGCDHNIHFGRRFGRYLLDPLEAGGFHIRFLMNLHNYRVGRRVVAENMQRYCRCHGTSGSCTLKTCYRRTPSMRVIGNQLKVKYEQASQVMRDNTLPVSWGHHGRSSPIVHLNRWNNQRILREVDHDSLLYQGGSTSRPPSLLKVSFNRSGRDQKPTTQELVFYEQPANNLFCEPNSNLHILGTRGRTCNSTSSASDSCRLLCCGRGHRTKHYYALENCECKFVWCCRVECQKCLVLKRQETCM